MQDHAETGLTTTFFWLAHDEVSGKPRVPDPYAGLGLSAAWVAELLLGEHLLLEDGILRVPRNTSAPGVVAHQLWQQVRTQSDPLPVRRWLASVTSSARQEVGRQLQHLGLARPQRSWLRRESRWLPVDVNAGQRAEVRVRAFLQAQQGPLDDAVLCGISAGTGLLGRVLDAAEARAGHEALSRVETDMPPMARLLVEETRSAVTAEMLSERR